MCFPCRIISSNRSHIVKLPLSRVGNHNGTLLEFFNGTWCNWIFYAFYVSLCVSLLCFHCGSNWSSCTPPTSSYCSAVPQPRRLVFALLRNYTAAPSPSSELVCFVPLGWHSSHTTETLLYSKNFSSLFLLFFYSKAFSSESLKPFRLL